MIKAAFHSHAITSLPLIILLPTDQVYNPGATFSKLLRKS